MLKNYVKNSVIVSSLFSLSAFSEDINLTTERFQAETIATDADTEKEMKLGGIGGEIIEGALKAGKITYKMDWTVWKRSQQQAMENVDKKTFIIPLTRNSEREAKGYVWVSKIYDAQTGFISLKSGTKFDSFKDVNGKKIGVLGGSSYEQTIADPKNGVNKSDVESVPVDSTNAKKLKAGKIAAWYGGLIGCFAIIKAEKMNSNDFQSGKQIDNEENYIATMPSTPADLVKKVADAVDNFKKTAAYKDIIHRYTGK